MLRSLMSIHRTFIRSYGRIKFMKFFIYINLVLFLTFSNTSISQEDGESSKQKEESWWSGAVEESQKILDKSSESLSSVMGNMMQAVDKEIENLKNNNNLHSGLNTKIPEEIKIFKFDKFDELLKSNVDLIVLGISSKGIEWVSDQLSKVYKNSNIKKENQKFLLQKMEFGLTEVILGYRVDELVGPIVVLGSGGVLAEILDDKSVRIAPVEISEAMEMIAEVKGLSIINGHRGMPKGDIFSLAKAIVSMSQLSFNKKIKEAEINPLIIKNDEKGVVAVDGLIILKTNN